MPNNEKYDVFISHSHADLDLAKNLAQYLSEKYNLECFVDSLCWGNIDDLLELINNKYSVVERYDNREIKTYNYDKSNKACRHCDMILASALTAMIDSSEAIFFLNTNNSVKSTSSIIQQNSTFSPWIYHEIYTISTIRKRELNRFHHNDTFSEQTRHGLNISYNLDLSNMQEINISTLNNWKPSEYNSLDNLYSLVDSGNQI